MVDDIYKEHILDHAQNPRNFGDLENADVTVREANASCGDLIQLALKISDDRSQITDIKFKGIGCAISTAAASLLTERIKNEELRIENAEKLTEKDMVEMMGIEISPTRMKCATLPLRALHKALAENGK